MLYDKSTGKTYIGSFSPTSTATAHQQLASAAGVSMSDAVGGSVRKNAGGAWEVGRRSESINSQNNYKTYGDRCGVAHGNRFVNAKKDLSTGNYFTVSRGGSVNKGTKHYNL